MQQNTIKHCKMVKSTINIPENENRILNIIKAKYGFKNKEQAFLFILKDFERDLEPELKPEYLKKLKKIEIGKHLEFKDINDLRRQIEG